jgi:Flavodoxin
MKKILLMYFSGAGATKKVAEIIYEHIKHRVIIEMHEFENVENISLQQYDAFIFGTPVYHGSPCDKAMRYIESLSPLLERKPAYIYNTKGMCQCNTNRIWAKSMKQKNIFVLADNSYKTPASDGVLIIPFVKSLFSFEKGLEEKIIVDCKKFLECLEQKNWQGYIPSFQLSSILNAPNKMIGKRITFQIYLHKSKCVKCEKCIRRCPYNILEKDKEGYPIFIKVNKKNGNRCENCYRCIHHCPSLALSLNRRKPIKKTLTY